MATWTELPQTNIEPEKPIRASDVWAIYQNIKALAEGAPGAPKIQKAALNAIWWEVDYTTKVTISGTSFTAPYPCICYITGLTVGGGTANINININGITVLRPGDNSGTGSPTTSHTATVILDTGAILTLSKSATINYYALKG
jgi:hypothetical protein